MYLSKLEILGFKSFPSKTEFLFNQGMTAIVGPNGCGKTNILDAIRWVLGEQRTSLLRGERMEEVIFNGTKELKPLGMAEVSLVIENNQGILPTEYQEVQITRRLFRSGESEYLLNKKICRLKDIIDLFLDTGMGTHAYSVIQPEMVESILSNKTEDRRFLFEEASGISKYKHRKKEAWRKLESTESDLLRLKDLTAEVERQVNSLKRQVRKAERFKRLSQELKEKELKAGKTEYDFLWEKEGQLEAGLREKEEQKVAHQAKLAELELKSEKLKLDLTQVEKKFLSSQKELEECLEALRSLEKENALNKERVLNLQENRKRLQKEIEENLLRRETIRVEIKEKEEKSKDVVEKVKSVEKEHQSKEGELKALEERLKSYKEKLVSLNSQLAEANKLLHQAELEEQNYRLQLDELARKQVSLEEEEKNIFDSLQTVHKEADALKGLIGSIQNSLEDKSKERMALQTKSEQTQQAIETLVNQKNEKEKTRSSLKAKLELLRDMVEHYEGYQAGVREILSKKDRIPGLIAPVASLINVEKEYQRAIEVALGEAAQFILAQDFESARKGIELLREEKKGRATFIILDRFKGLTLESPKVELEGNGIKSWAKELVKCKGEYQPVIDFLLGRIALADTLSSGIELSSNLGQEYGVVTLDGQVIKGGKIVEGGSEKEIFLVGRDEELNAISNELSSLEKELASLNDEIEAREKEKYNSISALSDLDRKIEEEKTRFNDSGLDLARQEELEKGLNQRQEAIHQKKDELSQELASLEEKGKDLRSVELNETRKIIEQEYEKYGKELEGAETEKESVYLNLNQLRIELVSLQGKEEQIKNETERLKELELDLVAEEESKRKESETLDSGMQELNGKIEQQKLELGSKEKGRVEKEEQAEIYQQELERMQPELASLEEELKSKRKIKEELQEILHKLELEKLEVSTSRENLKKKIWEEQEKDLEKVEPLSEEEKKEFESYPQRIVELKEKIKELGPVNLLALDEYQQQKDRLDFLQKQMQDLVEAKENLVSTIDKINATATELFLETFQKVKENFQQVFQTLFEGGEAEASLVEGIDPLESPIEISARPMGKKLININQLSGGEKALTALSLLFALYLVKPSPFCILDEVDAPLDDANLARFIKLIKNFSQKTQFIIITHNKLTMESADVLYGVTMEKPGVSKIVSVKLNPQEVIAEKS